MDTDHRALVSGEELTDSLIMAAQTMLAAPYPEIRGLQDIFKGRYLTFSSIPKNCVQIFYVGELASCTLVISMCFRVPSMRGFTRPMLC